MSSTMAWHTASSPAHPPCLAGMSVGLWLVYGPPCSSGSVVKNLPQCPSHHWHHLPSRPPPKSGFSHVHAQQQAESSSSCHTLLTDIRLMAGTMAMSQQLFCMAQVGAWCVGWGWGWEGGGGGGVGCGCRVCSGVGWGWRCVVTCACGVCGGGVAPPYHLPSRPPSPLPLPAVPRKQCQQGRWCRSRRNRPGCHRHSRKQRPRGARRRAGGEGEAA